MGGFKFEAMLLSRLSDLREEELSRIMKRSKVDLSRVMSDVERIVGDVKERGDAALREYTRRFDGVDIEDFRVSAEEFKEARSGAQTLVKALKKARENLEDFHLRQPREGWSCEKGGAKLGQIIRPIEKVGCYIPGGRAAYPSTVLMTVVPAKVAGVEKVICVTPPTEEGKANKSVLVACDIVGVDEVYKVGGAQGIAAMAYGTESIPEVDKIVGPGNIYVTAAKKLVSEDVAIEFPAGPSEVLIIADSSANPTFVALDMIAQAEHDPQASSILVTPSRGLAQKVKESLEKEERRPEAEESLEKNGAIIITETLEDAVRFSNQYSPEHLEIITENPQEVLSKIMNAGSVFIGNYTPVACGDYASGTNHVLPTGGFARVYSGLSVYDFVKRISVQEFDEKALKKLADTIITLAEVEGLQAHAESVRRRIK
jgi:histidinol dehydrogenase